MSDLARKPSPTQSGSDVEAEWPEIVDRSRRILAEHSRSFHWASKFLPDERRDDAAVVYAFCRTADDLADDADEEVLADRQLAALAAEIQGDATPRPLVAGFLDVAARRELRRGWALELLRGVRSDLGEVRIETDRQLLRYCYRVAGTVGLMMAPLLGVGESSARAHAVDLGVGMQLTNICRDVREDAEAGRTYLPRERLAAAGTSPEALLEGRADSDALARVVRSLLALADEYYESGRAGMRYIPRRSRLAIMIASRVYRGIGVKLLRRGADPCEGRIILGPFEKLLHVGRAAAAFVNPFGSQSPASHDRSLHRALAGMPGTNAPAGELDVA